MTDKKEMLLRLALVPILLIYIGFITKVMWQWFVVPLGVVEISIPWAIGLACLVRLLIMRWRKDNPPPMEAMGFSIGVPAFMLFIGYIAHLFM